MTPKTIVVSGFEPFGIASENPTLHVLEQLAAAPMDHGHLTIVRLPVEAARIAALVTETLTTRKPDLWIGLGLAMGSAVVAVERIGVNILDFAIPDNAGLQLQGKPIFADGPAAYWATLPVIAIVEDLRAGGIPAKVSNSASTYLCNQLMYTVLHLIERYGLDTRAGFLHVPAHPALAARDSAGAMASMSIDLMTAAVRRTIETAVGGPTAGS